MRTITEPRPVPAWTVWLLRVFPLFGLLPVVALVAGGDAPPLPFTLVFVGMFTAVPTIVRRAMERRVGVPGFGVSVDGLHDPAELEGDVVPWDRVRSLDWVPSDVSVNDVPLRTLVATTDEGTLQVTSHAGDGRFVERVTAGLLAGPEVPSHLRPAGAGATRVTGWSPATRSEPVDPGVPEGWTTEPLPPGRPDRDDDDRDDGRDDEPYWPTG